MHNEIKQIKYIRSTKYIKTETHVKVRKSQAKYN